MLNTSAARGNCFVIGSYSRFGIGIELALLVAERGGGQLGAGTDSAANHYGQLRAENPRRISVFAAPLLPLASF